MRVHEVSHDPGIDVVVELVQGLTGAHTAQGAFEAFMRQYWRYRPVQHFVGVIPDGSGPRRYRIAFRLDCEAVGRGGPVPKRNLSPHELEQLPVHEDGIIGHLIHGGRPAWLNDIDLSADPAVADLAGMRTCLALPMFSGNAVAEWVVGFSAKVDNTDVRDIQHALMTANFMSMNNAHLTLVDDFRRLNDRLTQQLEDVAKIQQSLLPERIPEIPGLRIATSYLTSDQAGGDYYDFFPLPNGQWGILIADVSGHGAAAATVMAMLHGILHCYTGPETFPDRVLAYANSKLVNAGIDGNFVTAFLAIYDPARATVTVASSGHNPPRLKCGRTGAVSGVDEPSSLPLGIFEPYEITSRVIHLNPMDTLVLYTDGITEEFNTSREMFGVKGLDAALDHCTGDPDCVVQSVHGALFEHTGKRTRADDQTLVVLRYVADAVPAPAAGETRP